VVGQISLIGQIGKFENNGKLEGIDLLDVITQVKALPEGIKVLNINIAGPGGLVDVGDDIYNYLDSLKKQYVVNTIQVGNIASIDTKLFLVGQQRIADRKFDFMIHNPWVDGGPGDSNHQAEVLEGLLQAEEGLRKFYSKQLNISEEGLKPLMDQETTLNADQLLALGFATSIKSNVLVMAMKKEENKGFNFSEKLKELGKKVKAMTGIKALDLQTDKGVLSVDAPNEDSLEGGAAMLNGQPAPDGPYTVTTPDETGMVDVVTVKGGVVESVVEQPAAQLPQAKGQESEISELKNSVALLIDSVSALLEESKANKASLEASEKASNENIEAKIVALKNEIGTIHTPKKASTVYAASVNKEEVPMNRPIAVRLKEIEERKKNKK